MNTYLIELRGQVDVNELNPMSPHQMTMLRTEPTTLLAICTDQAGLIGMLRHLHNLGFDLLLVLTQAPAANQPQPTARETERNKP